MSFIVEFRYLLEEMAKFCHKELDNECIDALKKNGLYLYNSEEYGELLGYLEELRNYGNVLEDNRERFLVLNRITECESFIRQEEL